MRKYLVSMLAYFVTVLSVSSIYGDSYIVDEILASIYHPEGNEIVLLSDLIGIDGQERTLQDIVLERLMVLDARRYKVVVADEELDRFLANLQKQNGWTRNDFIMFLDERGYSFEEGRELLRAKQMVNQMIDHKVRTDKRMSISREQAQSYYEASPEYEEASYTLDIAYVPTSQYNREQLEKMSKSHKLPDDIHFDEAFTLKANELPEDRRFVEHKTVGDIVLIEPVADGHELTRLVAKSKAETVPFDFQRVASRMRQERFKQVLEDYQKELLAHARIKYARPELAI